MPEKHEKADDQARAVPVSKEEPSAPVEEAPAVVEPEVPAVEAPEQPPVKLRLVADWDFDETLVATPNSAERIKVTKDGVEVKADEAQHLLDTPYIEVATEERAD